MNRAVFLDRDGTMSEEVGYLDRLDRLVLHPYAVESVRVLKRAGYLVVVITNQAGVAHGHFTEDFVRQVHDVLRERFARAGAAIDAFYYCPHFPEARIEAYRKACACRKPQPGMVLAAARDLGIDLARSYVIGDQWADIGLGHAAGVRTILVRTGYGPTVEKLPRDGIRPDVVVGNLIEAVSWILRADRGAGRG